MADQNPTATNTPAPPRPGARPSVRVDAQFADDLAVIMSTGVTFTDAVRDAVNVLAVIYRGAWQSGACPTGTAPQIISANLAAPDRDEHAA